MTPSDRRYFEHEVGKVLDLISSAVQVDESKLVIARKKLEELAWQAPPEMARSMEQTILQLRNLAYDYPILEMAAAHDDWDGATIKVEQLDGTWDSEGFENSSVAWHAIYSDIKHGVTKRAIVHFPEGDPETFSVTLGVDGEVEVLNLTAWRFNAVPVGEGPHSAGS